MAASETIVVLEPNPFWREAVGAVAEGAGFSHILMASSPAEARQLTRRWDPLLFVYGLADSLDGDVWRTYLQTVQAEFPDVKIIVLSAIEDDDAIAAALRAGAFAYLFRRSDPDDLRTAIQQALQPTVFQAQPGMSVERRSTTRDPLTPRQREIVQLVADGRSNAEIADLLDISVATVKGHLWRSYRRLGVRNRADVVRRLRENVRP